MINIKELEEMIEEVVHGKGCIDNAINWIPEKGEDELLNYAKITSQVIGRFRDIVIKRFDKLNVTAEDKIKLVTCPEEPVGETAEVFKKEFGLDLKDYCDVLGSCTVGKFMFSIYKFANYLREKHGDYESSGLSMLNLVQQKYGDKAVLLIQLLT